MTPPESCEDFVARAGLHAHEDLCAERYRRIDEALERIERAGEHRTESIRHLYREQRLWLVGVLLALAGIAGYLFTRAYP